MESSANADASQIRVETLIECVGNKPEDISQAKDLINDLQASAVDLSKIFDEDGRTLAHRACGAGNTSIAGLLFPLCDTAHADAAGWTILHSAAAAGYLHMVHSIMELDKAKALLNRQTETGGTALHYAAAKGQLLVVQRLIQEGCDLEMRDRNGHTPLMKAVCLDREDVVEYLISRKASLSVVEPVTEDNLLHIAVNNHAVGVGARLYEAAPQLAAQVNKKGQAPADVASRVELLEWKAIRERQQDGSDGANQGDV